MARSIKSSRSARCFNGLLATGLLCLISASANADTPDLKAAFIYRLATMTTWPEEALGGTDNMLCFAIVGDEAIARALTKVLDGRRLHERHARALSISDPSGHSDCLVAFFSRRLELQSIPESTTLTKKPILTLGDGKDFAERGGMVQLFREGRHLRFVVNLKALEGSGLKLNSNVLRLARDVLK